ncbi:MAG: hypothetical protein WBQ44_11350 [Rhodococcus sp. (in: high G+C Gram-positive bacteria)]
MTATVVGDPGSAEEAPKPQRPDRPVAVVVFYWTVLFAAVIVAFFPTGQRLVQEARDGAITTYIFVLPFLAAVAAQGIARRRSGELPIHDRQTDIIVGGLALLGSLAIKGLWLPRYVGQYELAHLDVLAGLVFFLGGAILLFGLRPVGRFWSVWLLLLALSPLVYRMAAITVGGSRFAYGAVLILLAGVAGAIAVGRTRRRAVFGFCWTVVVGFAMLALMLAVSPGAHIAWLQLVPTVGAAILVGSGFFLVARHGKPMRPMDRRIAPVTAKNSLSSLVTVIVAAVLLLLIPIPSPKAVPSTPGPPLAPVVAPRGWTQTDELEFDWVKSFFGRTSTLSRHIMRADEGNPAWDVQSRPRTVVVDVLSTVNRASLAVYPESTLYKLGNTRTSGALDVDLGRGVTGQIYTSVSDALLLTWTKLVFTWVRGETTQRITVVSVDNHEEDAVFPQPEPSMASNVSSSIATFLRGNTIAVDDDPEYKDLELLSAFGTSLVRAQWGSS